MKHLLFIFSTFFILNYQFSFAHAAAQAVIPKTGQTTPYAAGDDGTLRPGVAWPAPRFTNNGNGTVTDNLTGLNWLQNANCIDSAGGVAKANGYLTWADALTWSNNLASGKCGLSDGSSSGDWRLPNVEELESLVDLQRYNPALPSDHPFTNVQANVYWSSSTNAINSNVAWFVYMIDGYVYNNIKTSSIYVWPVRGALGSLTLSATKTGTGAGTLTSSPAGISCGSTCSAGYTSGTQVILTADYDSGSIFAGWSGACSETGACTVTMDAAKTVTATFTLILQPTIPSITWRHQGDGKVYGMTTDGSTVTGGAQFWQETNLAWSIVGQGDFDGDGIRDLVWWNSSTGQVYIM